MSYSTRQLTRMIARQSKRERYARGMMARWRPIKDRLLQLQYELASRGTCSCGRARETNGRGVRACRECEPGQNYVCFRFLDGNG